MGALTRPHLAPVRGIRGPSASWRNDATPRTKPDAKGPNRYVNSQLQIATELLQTRRLEEAERVLNEALTRHPNHPALLDCMARVAQRDGRWADALRHWQTLSAAQPDRAEASLNQIKALTKLQRFAEAEQLLRVVGQRWPDRPRVIEALASAAERDMRWAEALKCWRRLANAHPSHAASLVGQHIAMCEIKLGRVGDAGRSLEEEIGARQEAPVLQRMLGSHARFVSYYGRRIEDAFRDLT